MSKLPKAKKFKFITLSSLTDENDNPIELQIQKISVKYIGFDATMRLVQSNALAREAAHRANEGSVDAASLVNPSEAYPGTPQRYEYGDANDPALKVDLLRESEIAACISGCVSPTFAEICEAYDADISKPWEGMGSEFDDLVNQITVFSGYGGEGKKMTPQQAERFPKGVGTND